MFKKINTGILISMASIFILAGCGGGGDSSRSYKVSLKNITLSQAFAPAAIIVQDSTTNFEPYTVGMAASLGLETLAEAGDPQVLLDEANNSNVVYTGSFDSLTTPGSTNELTFTVDNKSLNLAIASMLVKTNDAFVATKDINLDFIGSKTFYLNVYDAGTEANDELTTTVPALGGEGFNPARDDTQDLVTLHAGVVTQDDGLSTSGLTFSDRWDNPAAVLTIERIY